MVLYPARAMEEEKRGRGQGKAAEKKKNPKTYYWVSMISMRPHHITLVSSSLQGHVVNVKSSEIMSQMGIDTTVLHSMMTQQLRGSNLNKFKNQTVGY